MIAVLGGASTATFGSLIKMWKLGDTTAQIADDPTRESDLVCHECLCGDLKVLLLR